MNILRHHFGREVVPRPVSNCVAALGNFDGIHQGHAEILKKLREIQQEKSLPSSAVVSFYPHPVQVLRKFEVRQLTTLREKVRILKENGIDRLHLLHFSERLSNLSAQDFIDKILMTSCAVDTLVVGPDAAVGKGREGDVAFLQKVLHERGKELVVVDPLLFGGQKIGSREIRKCIERGEVDQARSLLGRPYLLEGRIVPGSARGRALGFPTANMSYRKQLLPLRGVYATRLWSEGRAFPALTNIGFRPTFEDVQRIHVETYLIDQSIDLYSKRVELEFFSRLREERKFDSKEDLLFQIERDLKRAKDFFAQHPEGQ